ncbi:MAG: ankyrin repeat domain-containing protein [Pseudomonadota bacterium]
MIRSTTRCILAVFFSLAFFGFGSSTDTHAANSVQKPALIEATLAGDLERVAHMLQSGVPVNSHDDHNNTALTFAARDGQSEIARLLIAHGAQVNWQDDEKVTPLILAAFQNYPEIVRILLAKGADPDIVDQWGRRAIDYALRRGSADEIYLLLKERDP